MVRNIVLPMPHSIARIDKQLHLYAEDTRKFILRFLVNHSFYRALKTTPLEIADLKIMYNTIYQQLCSAGEGVVDFSKVHQFSKDITENYARLIPEFRDLMILTPKLFFTLVSAPDPHTCIRIIYQDTSILVVQEEQRQWLLTQSPTYVKSIESPMRIA